MAVTGAVTVSTATPKTLNKVACTLTLTNGGSTAVSVTSVVPTCVVSGQAQATSAVNLGQPNIGPGMTTSIAGSSGTLKINFDAVPMSPQCGTYTSNPFPSAGIGGAITNLPPTADPQSQAYDIGALCTFSDGSVLSATVGTITVAAVNF